MDALTILLVGGILYALGIILMIRFGSFMHDCDDDVRSMIKPSRRMPRLFLRRTSRMRKPRPRVRTA